VPELLALGATPCLIAVLDVSAADCRSSGGTRLLQLLPGRLLALALALVAVFSEVSLSETAGFNGTSHGPAALLLLLLLALTTVTCVAFVTTPTPKRRWSSGALQGFLAWIGFCLPIIAVLSFDTFDPSAAGTVGIAVVIQFFLYFYLLLGTAIAAVILAPLVGILGGTLRRMWTQE
jgi:hypothetical protein